MKNLFAIACFLTSTLAADSASSFSQNCPVTPQCCPEFKSCGVTYGLYGEFLYLQPNYTDLYYGASAVGLNSSLPLPAAAASPYWTILEIQPDYHCGFEIGASLLLNCPNVQIEVSWERLHGKDSSSFQTSAADGYMVGPFFDIGPNSAAYKIAEGNVLSHFDEVDLKICKKICFFNNFYTRFFGGASFIRIKQILDSNYSNFANTVSRNIKTNSTFTGAGPQIGLDYNYRIYNTFFFAGSSALSLCMGQMKNSTTYQSFTPELAAIGLSQPNNQAVTIPNRVQLIPAFEQKLGFSYLATWDCFRAAFEIGYQCQIYVDAVQTMNMASQALPPDAITDPDVGEFAVAFEQCNSNFILTGPYASVSVDF
ncbi:MAG: Lpg1974 family pore-forming outer membrane protein [Chlamydiota bacterium]